MDELRALGVRVGMDDFGTGHSSLAYLADLPFDFVKIDRSFLARFVEDRRAAALLASVATLCRTLGLAAYRRGRGDGAAAAPPARSRDPLCSGVPVRAPGPAGRIRTDPAPARGLSRRPRGVTPITFAWCLQL